MQERAEGIEARAAQKLQEAQEKLRIREARIEHMREKAQEISNLYSELGQYADAMSRALLSGEQNLQNAESKLVEDKLLFTEGPKIDLPNPSDKNPEATAEITVLVATYIHMTDLRSKMDEQKQLFEDINKSIDSSSGALYYFSESAGQRMLADENSTLSLSALEERLDRAKRECDNLVARLNTQLHTSWEKTGLEVVCRNILDFSKTVNQKFDYKYKNQNGNWRERRIFSTLETVASVATSIQNDLKNIKESRYVPILRARGVL